MTQEEAGKFLINKKVFVKDKSKEIQLKLFEIGFRWYTPPFTEARFCDYPFLYINESMTLSTGYSINTFYKDSYKEISAEDILNIKITYLPKTWEEFCKQNEVKEGEYYINSQSDVVKILVRNYLHRRETPDRNILPNKKAAEQHLALMQLHQLRDCYRGNVDPYECQYAIVRGLSGLIVVKDITAFLFFPTKKMAEEFLANFKDLIEEAGDLI